MVSSDSSDFEILKILWKHKQLSNREIHEIIGKKNRWAYSTTRTTVERMVKKKLLTKENFHGINVFKPAISKVHTFAIQITQFAEKILEQDALSVVPLFAKSSALSDEEIRELKNLLKSQGRETK